LPFLWLDLIVSGKTILPTHERQCSNFYLPLPTDSAEEAINKEEIEENCLRKIEMIIDLYKENKDLA